MLESVLWDHMQEQHAANCVGIQDEKSSPTSAKKKAATYHVCMKFSAWS